MPSLLSKLGLKKSQPKVFVAKAPGDPSIKKSSWKPSRMLRKSKKTTELVVAESVEHNETANENISYNRDDGVDLSNSVMFKNLSALKENSILENQEMDEVSPKDLDVSSIHEREDSMATFVEDEPEDSILQEEKEDRAQSSSPIAMIAEEKSTAESVVEIPGNREDSNIKQDSIAAAEVSSEIKVEPSQTISVVVVQETTVETVEPAKDVVEVSEPVKVTVPTSAAKLSNRDVLETLKRNNLVAAQSPNSAVGSLRARFENASAKPPTPSLKSVLAARNTAKFAGRVSVTPVEVTTAPVVVVEAAPVAVVEETKTVEVVEVATEITAPLKEEVLEKVQAPEVIASVVVIEEAIKEEIKPLREIKKVSASTSAMAELVASGDEKALFSAMMDIAAKPYKDQAVWFLNAYWNELFKSNAQACERVWQFCFKFAELDSQNGAKGCELDELRAHRVLELLAEALTFTEMRTKFHRRAKHVSLIELLIFVFAADWTQVVVAPQGSEAALEQMQQAEALMARSSSAVAESKSKATESAEAEQRAMETAKLAQQSKTIAVAGELAATEAEQLAIASEQEASLRAEEASSAFEVASRAAEDAANAEAATCKRAEESAKAELEARQGEEQATKAQTRAVEDERAAREAESEAFRREQAAKQSEQSSMDAEKGLIEGQARVEAALNKVKEEEAAFHKVLQDLKDKSENTSMGIVARRTANHEREMLLAKNPDPLTRARIAEEAVVRKHEKLIRQAAEARVASTRARSDAEQSRDLAVKSRVAAENACAEAAVRKSAAETKSLAASEARALSEAAREAATKAREESDSRRKASDEALEAACHAKESASNARRIAASEREVATDAKLRAEQDEREAVAAKQLASASRENAEKAVLEAVQAFERARQFVERVRKQASSGQGGWWWASREIEESKKYVPQRMLKKLAEEQIAF